MMKNRKTVCLPLIDDIISKISQFCDIHDLISMLQIDQALHDMVSIKFKNHNNQNNKNCWKYTQCIFSQFKDLNILCHNEDVTNQSVN